MSKKERTCNCPTCGSQVPRGRLRKTALLEVITPVDREADLSYIRNAGMTLDYGLIPGRKISVAYRWNTDKVDLYFAVRAEKDPFSRPHARRALAEHMKNDTHHVTFKLLKAGKGHELYDEIRFSSTLRDILVDRMESHPHEFPNYVIRRLQKFDARLAEIGWTIKRP